MKLREYQNKAIKDIQATFLQGHKKIVLQAPTGSGKTVMFTFMLKTASGKNWNCLLLTDRIELLQQANGTFDNVGVNYKNITAETKVIPDSKVLVAMVETMKRRAKARLDFQMLLKRINLLIIDECHKHTFDNIFKFLDSECFVIGFTATPIRTNKNKPLSKYFTHLITSLSIEQLIFDNYLSKPKYFGVDVDLSSVKLKAGEFDENDMTKLYGERKLFEGLKHNLDLHARGLKTMIFCPSIQSSLEVAKELNCLHVDGTMPKEKRKAVLYEFENNDDSIITNVGITTTGYDCPSIRCIVLYRATTSLPLYLQMIGRGSRVMPNKKEFIILDFGMNVQRFGYWHIDRNWTLDIKKSSKKNKDTFPIKFCPKCDSILSINKRICDFCGYEYVIPEKEREFIELKKLSYEDTLNKLNKASSIDEMENIRIAKNYKIGFLLYRFKTFEQFKEYERLKNYKPGWAYIQAKRYGILK